MPSEDSICIPQICTDRSGFYPEFSMSCRLITLGRPSLFKFISNFIHRRSHVKADFQTFCRPHILCIQVTAVKASGRCPPSCLCQFPLQVSCMSFRQLTITVHNSMHAANINIHQGIRVFLVSDLLIDLSACLHSDT